MQSTSRDLESISLELTFKKAKQSEPGSEVRYTSWTSSLVQEFGELTTYHSTNQTPSCSDFCAASSAYHDVEVKSIRRALGPGSEVRSFSRRGIE